MAQQVQLRRGTAADHATFTGAVGEVTVDTTSNVIRVHDGSKVGGYPMVNNTNPTFTGTLTMNTVGSYIQFPDGTKQYSAAPQFFYMILPGNLYTPLTGINRYYPSSATGITISQVYANIGSPSTQGSISIDILVNNSVINTLTLAAGAFYGTLNLSQSVSAGSYVSINVNTGNGSDLNVKFTYTNN
jgi:Major tropism determinant N-terminal domain